MKKIQIITIDGPAASGKTTVAKMLAQKLNFSLLESGSLYRTVTYFLLNSEKPIDSYFENKQILFQFLENLLREIKVEISPSGTYIYWDGKLIKDRLKSKEVESKVSQVSAIKEVREILTDFMRNLGKKGELVAEGRDMGSVVFPHAEFKIFLTADERIRIERRFKEKVEKEEIDRNFLSQEIWDNIRLRDKMDSERKIAPLIIPEGAYIIDTSYLTLEEVIDKIFKIIESKEK